MTHLQNYFNFAFLAFDSSRIESQEKLKFKSGGRFANRRLAHIQIITFFVASIRKLALGTASEGGAAGAMSRTGPPPWGPMGPPMGGDGEG